VFVGLALLAATGCGKRGAPLAPIRHVPGPVTDLTARRLGDRIQIEFKIPTENTDHTTPPVISRVDIYAAAGPPSPVSPAPFAFPPVPLLVPVNGVPAPILSTPFLLSRLPPVRLADPTATAPGAKPRKKGPPPATTGATIMTSKHLRGQIEVRPAPVETAPGQPADADAAAPVPVTAPAAPPDPRPMPGSPATFTETIGAELAAAAADPDASVLRYIVVPAASGRRFGAPSPILEFPLTLQVPPPQHLSYAYDAATLAIAWTPGAPLQSFRLYRTDPAGQELPDPAPAPPLTVPLFSQPVEFGHASCFVVRSVLARGAATVESEPAGPVCVEPVDTFAPPAPTGLSSLPTETQVQLLWTPVAAPDLAGYLVLRSDDGGAPAAITPAPLTEPSYTDTSVRTGVHYVYTVVAVDAAGNRSGPSNAVDEVR
jgi:hypothetical protein